jgi:hypothetical protein
VDNAYLHIVIDITQREQRHFFYIGV